MAVSVKAQRMVNCFAEPSCLGNQNAGTEEDCSKHGVAPLLVCHLQYQEFKNAFHAQWVRVDYSSIASHCLSRRA